MNKATTKITIASALLTGTSLALAHGDGKTGISFYHYLSSPDHVAVFTLIALTTLGGGLYFLHNSLRAVRQKKD